MFQRYYLKKNLSNILLIFKLSHIPTLMKFSDFVPRPTVAEIRNTKNRVDYLPGHGIRQLLDLAEDEFLHIPTNILPKEYYARKNWNRQDAARKFRKHAPHVRMFVGDSQDSVRTHYSKQNPREEFFSKINGISSGYDFRPVITTNTQLRVVYYDQLVAGHILFEDFAAKFKVRDYTDAKEVSKHGGRFLVEVNSEDEKIVVGWYAIPWVDNERKWPLASAIHTNWSTTRTDVDELRFGDATSEHKQKTIDSIAIASWLAIQRFVNNPVVDETSFILKPKPVVHDLFLKSYSQVIIEAPGDYRGKVSEYQPNQSDINYMLGSYISRF